MLINDRHLFLEVLEAQKSKTKEPADLVPSKDQLSGSQTAIISLCPLIREVEGELSAVSFLRALIPFMRACPS